MSKSNEKKQYFSVPEFAAMAGVTKQAVYDRIKKDLGGFTVKQGGKTLISEEALCMVGNGAVVHGAVSQSSKQEDGQEIEQVSQAANQAGSQFTIETSCLVNQESQATSGGIKRESERLDETSQEVKQEIKQSSKEGYDLLEYLIKENARLIAENERKDKIIEEKDKELRTYTDRIIGLTEQFAQLVEREQEISSKALNTTGQAQLLHAMSSEAIDGSAVETDGEVTEKKLPWWKRKRK